MKLLRWALAGASVYVVYKYTIGKRTAGENVFVAFGGGDGARQPARPGRALRSRQTAWNHAAPAAEDLVLPYGGV